MWKSGSTPRPRRPAVCVRATVAPASARCSSAGCRGASIAAFGEPAVPLVNISTARSSSAPFDDRRAGSVASRSSSRIRPGTSTSSVTMQNSSAGSFERSSRRQRRQSRRGDDDRAWHRSRPARDSSSGAGLLRVERHGDQAGAERRQVGDDEVPVVAAQDADPVARLEAEAGQPRRTAATCSRSSRRWSYGRG